MKLSHYKTTINDFLNNQFYNWRSLHLCIAKYFSNKYNHDEGKYNVLIIDDTSKNKSGKYVEYLSRFFDHSQQTYYNGYQVIFATWSNLRTCIPIDLALKTGKKRCKHARKGNYAKNSHTFKRYKESRLSKLKISISMIYNALKHRIKFNYVLWDSWYSCSEAFVFVFTKLIPKKIHLVSMIKVNNEKYKYCDQDLTLKEIYKKAGKWKSFESNGIKYKSVEVEIMDKSSKRKKIIGKVKLCFFRFPGQKRNKYKVLLCTDTQLAEEEILEIYTYRWSIEVMIKDLKQYFGFNQSMSSKYAPQIADLSIKCIFTL